MSLKLITSLFHPCLDWIQVEVTSACNAACMYCPHTVYRKVWKERYFPPELFKRLVPTFRKTRHVHLQGWGEPFLHPHFFNFVRIAKAAGCRVGTTTNGMLFDIDLTGRLVDSGLDVAAFSLAGTDALNDAIRAGTRLETVLKAMKTLRAQREHKRTQTPEIHVAYLLLRSGLSSLERLPNLLADAGADRVVISTLDFVPSARWEKEILIPKNRNENQELIFRLNTVAQKGEANGLGVHHYLHQADLNGRFCTENIGRALCVAADGAVTPCVFTNLDVSGVEYRVDMESRPYQRWAFGNIGEDSLRKIWKKPAYSAFRRSISTGDLSSPCKGCLKLKDSLPII